MMENTNSCRRHCPDRSWFPPRWESCRGLESAGLSRQSRSSSSLPQTACPVEIRRSHGRVEKAIAVGPHHDVARPCLAIFAAPLYAASTPTCWPVTQTEPPPVFQELPPQDFWLGS